MAELGVDDFPSFMREVTGFEPFPWQHRLVGRVLDEGWPALLDLPTGSGKTSSLLVALFAHALDPVRFPRRIVLTVDRRIIVDQVTEFGEKVRDALEATGKPTCAAVRARLIESAGPGCAQALRVVQLRGGIPRDDSWITSPRQPMLVASTVDQVGSRLLFRGYGVSQGMRPIHAGLLAHDTLLMLDEVHLSTAFDETLSVLGSRYTQWPERPLPKPLQVVRLSATSRGEPRPECEVLRLDANDRHHPDLARRLTASRLARLVSIKTRAVKRPEDEQEARAAVSREAAARAEEALDAGCGAIGVIVNRIDTARMTAESLRERTEADVVLMTGRMRPIERRRVDQVVGERVRAGAEVASDARPIIVVSTQCVEVGADYDFDALVTECASLDALRQRFGRLNRLGTRSVTRAWVLMRSDQASDQAVDPIYGTALRVTWEHLVAVSTDEVIDFGLEAFPEPDEMEPLLSPSPEAPLLFPAYLDAWAQTRPIPHPDPDVSLWLHGKDAQQSDDVQLVFRAGLLPALDRASPKDAEVASVNRLLDWVPPSTIEALSVPRWAVQRWLRGRPIIVEGADVDGERRPSDPRRHRPQNEPPRGVWRWTTDGAEWIDVASIRPGDTLVAPCEAGGMSAFNWDPGGRGPVEDLGELANAEGRGLVRVRLSRAVLPQALHEGIPKVPAAEEVSYQEARDACLEWIEATARSEALSGPWQPLFRSLAAGGGKLALSIAQTPQGESIWLVGDPTARDARAMSSEESISSFIGHEVTLRQHGGDVRAWAEAFTSRIGLPASLRSDVVFAAWLHDIGKAHPRFQALLTGGDPVRAALDLEPLAKSSVSSSLGTRERAAARARWPSGLRHELFSLRLFDASAEWQGRANDVDLVRHLIASHHGWCRPWAPAVFEDDPVSFEFEDGGVSTAIRSDALGEEISGEASERFSRLNDRYGWFGLAYLEALVRLADHNASARPGASPTAPDQGLDRS